MKLAIDAVTQLGDSRRRTASIFDYALDEQPIHSIDVCRNAMDLL